MSRQSELGSFGVVGRRRLLDTRLDPFCYQPIWTIEIAAFAWIVDEIKQEQNLFQDIFDIGPSL